MRPFEPGAPGRRPAAEVPGITGLRFMPQGAAAALVNISPTGLLAESATRLPVGSAVELQFEGAFSPSAVAGRVARCEVAAMARDGVLWYHIAVEFDTPIPLDTDAPRPAPPPASRDVRNRW